MPNLLGKLASWLGRRPQPAAHDANHPFFQSADYKAAIARITQSAFADGVSTERARIIRSPECARSGDVPRDRRGSGSWRRHRRSSSGRPRAGRDRRGQTSRPIEIVAA
jgi:hypothetical protein